MQYLLFLESTSCLAGVCKNFNFVEGVKIAFSTWVGWCSTPTWTSLKQLWWGEEAAVFCLALGIKPTSLGASQLFSIWGFLHRPLIFQCYS